MKRMFACLLSLAMLLALIGCGGSSSQPSDCEDSASSKEIVIKYPTFQVGANTAAPVVAKLVEEFNAEYTGSTALRWKMFLAMPTMPIKSKS